MVGLVAGLVLASFTAAASVAPAGAHSFLVRTDPAQGARLADPPASIALQFTEPIVTESATVTVRRSGGDSIAVPDPEPEADGSALRLMLPPELGEGIYVVSWQGGSAVDGHVSAGEFAFAVGNAASPLPAATAGTGADAGGTLVRWLFFVGLAVGLGALGAGQSGQIGHPRRARWARAGLIIAALAAGLAYVGVLGSGGLSSPPITLAAAVVLLVLSASLAGPRRRGRGALVLAGLASVGWAWRSHAATAGGLLGVVADAAHLVAGAMWVGMLLLLVSDVWSRRTVGGIIDTTRRYARPALVSVLILAGAGLVSAVSLLTSPADLWTTGYGRLIGLKVALFFVAVILAAGARRWALRPERVRLLRLATSAELTILASILVATAVLAGSAPPALATAPTESLLGPPPIDGPVSRAAALAGDMTIGVTAGDERLEIRVYDDAAGGIDDAEIELSASLPGGASADLHPRPCGTGCFTQEFEFPLGRTELSVSAVAADRAPGRAVLFVDWPPETLDAKVLDSVISAMTRVERLTLTETVSSGPRAEATSSHTMAGREFIDLELYGRGGVDELVRIPGDLPGLRMYLPGSRILIELWTDEQMRIVRQRIVSPSHEITRRFDYSSDPDAAAQRLGE